MKQFLRYSEGWGNIQHSIIYNTASHLAEQQYDILQLLVYIFFKN